MLKKYTIRDIAELAGVSKGTVDRVLHKRGKVSEDALEKVNKILAEIDYKPNPIAKNLKNNKIYHICVLLPDPEKDAYWESCIVGINEAISELSVFGINIETIFFDHTSTKSFLNANLKIQKSKPDAVLLAPTFFKEASIVMQDYENMNIKVSVFNNDIATEAVTSFIGQDLFQSGRVGAKLLHSIIEFGDVAVIHIDEKYKNAVFMQKKEKGFKNFFKHLPNYNVLKCKLKNLNFDNDLNGFLMKNPDIKGIFVTTSKIYKVADFLQKNKFNHIALVGYDLLNENVVHLNTGVIDFLIHQKPKQQAYFGLKYLVEYFLFEKEIPKQVLLPIDIINSENVKPFMRS